jgi:phospholipid/cholesterol/gamma-HCH transport system substrate-binding protein
MRKFVLLPLIGLVLALGLSACSKSLMINVSAKFDDIGDLASGAPVMMSDIQVGQVKSIHLTGYKATVDLALDPAAEVPRDVTARVRRTSLLGERIVDLVPDENLPRNAPLLKEGDSISRTLTRPDLEDLVSQGTEVLQPITASQIATLIDEGAKGFGGNGDQLRTVLNNFADITHVYAGETDTIASLISSLNELNGSIAKNASAHGLSVRNTQKALDVLNAESAELEKAIKSLARLAGGARSLLDVHVDEMSRSFGQLRVILGQLQKQQADLIGFLKYAPLHDRNTQLVEYLQFNQIYQDFVICGANEDKTDPARTCTPGQA